MNEFTKEELIFIKRAMRIADVSSMEFNSDDMANKIQTMIENYCEHDLDNSCCGCSMEAIYCEKCDFRMKENDNK